jgi:hypothetical protein
LVNNSKSLKGPWRVMINLVCGKMDQVIDVRWVGNGERRAARARTNEGLESDGLNSGS